MNDMDVNDYFRTLAKVSIDAMRDIGAKGEKLSSKSLAAAMLAHKDIKALTKKAIPVALSQEPNAAASEIENLKSQTKIIQSQKDQLLKQLHEVEDQQTKAEGFYKNAIVTFINLLADEKNNPLAGPLKKFKALIQKENNIDIFMDAFNRIKDAALREDFQTSSTTESEEHAKSPSFLSRWLKKPVSETLDGGEIQEIFYRHLKNAYQEIVDELGLLLGEEYLKKLSRISKQIFKSSNFDDLTLTRKSILSLIQDYFNKISSERELAAEIIKEIGERLIEVEKHIVATFSAASKTFSSDSDFNTTLKEQITELQNNVNFSKTLAELKKAVIYRLNVLNDALTDKIKNDLIEKETYDKQMTALKQSLDEMNQKVMTANDQTKRLAKEILIDPLTEIYNRRAYDRRIDEEIKRYQRYGSIFSLVLFDVDHFKKINDQYGHAIGDKCLQEIIKRIKPALRGSDFIARYGGEEFIILLPETQREGAEKVAEKLRNLVEKIEFLHKETLIQITISAGVTCVQQEDTTHETIFNRVDLAMYDAKNSGRNRVVVR